MATSDPAAAGKAILEFVRYGNVVKATAVDPATGVEASIIGPVTASEGELGRAAVNKLGYLLRRQAAD